MIVKEVNISELRNYVDAAFADDEDILFYYDKKENVKTIDQACANVVKKIENSYIDSKIVGIKINGSKVGYFVYSGDLLISFGLNKGYRDKVILMDMWEKIKDVLGDTFQCLLYSYNVRAVNWLKRCGMNILFDNVTVLRFENNLN